MSREEGEGREGGRAGRGGRLKAGTQEGSACYEGSGVCNNAVRIRSAGVSGAGDIRKCGLVQLLGEP